MKVRRVFGWLVLGTGVVLGCRGVLGIEDLSVDADAGGTPEGGTSEGGNPEGGSEGGAESGTPDAGNDASSEGVGIARDCKQRGMTGPMCLKCCRDAKMVAGGQLEELGRDAGCICGSGACQTECATTACAMPPMMGGPGGACPGCIDGNLAELGCALARTRCKQSATCAPIADCFEECKR